MSHDVLILGVSARAASESAIRAGLRPHCADWFADCDLAAIAPADRVDPSRGPDGFLAIAERLPPSPWFYTGGLENHPDLIDRIARRQRLWGVGAVGLRRVRDPVLVASELEAAGIPVPEVRTDPAGLPRDGSWLTKPIASGGGIGVGPLIGSEGGGDGPRYYQRRIVGPSYSALFIAGCGRARLVGVVRQWVGGVSGRPFAYRGGIGPCRISANLGRRLGELGDRLAVAFDLVGWFGVDYVRRDGIPWPVEVNPRYTASVEIHERATGRPLLLEHRDACEGLVGPRAGPPPRLGVVAKWIVYARRRLVFPAAWPDATSADIPAAGTVIQPGDPVITLMATGPDAASCRARLRRLRRSLSRTLRHEFLLVDVREETPANR